VTPRASDGSHDDRPVTDATEGSGTSGGASTIVDARGARCPMPVIMMARAAAALPGGSLVTVLATDPAARHDVPAWARMRGHTLVDDDPELSRTGEIRLTVRLSADD